MYTDADMPLWLLHTCTLNITYIFRENAAYLHSYASTNPHNA